MNKIIDFFHTLVNEHTNKDYPNLVSHLMNGVMDFIFLMEKREDSYYYDFVNEAAQKRLGIEGDWKGKMLEDILPKAKADLVKERYDAVVMAGESLTYEDDYDRDGGTVYGHNVLTPLFNDAGVCTHILAVTRDITDRVLKEQESTRITEIYESLMKNTADAFLILSPDRKVLEANPAFVEMYGWTYAELQKSSLPFVPEELKEESAGLIQKVMNGQSISSFETMRETKDGTRIDVAISMAPLHNTNKEIVAISSIIRDISSQKQFEKRLEESKSRYASLFQYSPDPIFQLDLSGVIAKVNPSFEKVIGRPKDELKHHSFLEFVPEQDFASVLSHIKCATAGETTVFETRVNCEEKVRVFDITTSPIYSKNQLYGVYCIMQDKTEKLQALTALRASEEKYRIIADHSHDLIAVYRTNGTATYVSPSHEFLLGEKINDLHSRSLTVGVHEDDVDALKRCFYQSLVTQESFTVNVRKQDQTDHWIWYEAIGTPVANSDGEISHVVIVSRDIRERMVYEERLKEIAFYDYLTDLPNKRLFEDRLEQVIAHSNRQQKPFALMYLDGDGFKEINDELGHQVGDEYLKRVGKRLNGWVRREDTVARIGGDEFAVLLTDIDSEEEVIEVTKRLRNSLAKPYDIDGEEITASFSIGVSLFPRDGQDKDTVVQCADQALYAAKEQGKDCIRFFDNPECL